MKSLKKFKIARYYHMMLDKLILQLLLLQHCFIIPVTIDQNFLAIINWFIKILFSWFYKWWTLERISCRFMITIRICLHWISICRTFLTMINNHPAFFKSNTGTFGNNNMYLILFRIIHIIWLGSLGTFKRIKNEKNQNLCIYGITSNFIIKWFWYFWIKNEKFELNLRSKKEMKWN